MEEKLLAIADEVIALSASNEQIEVIAVHDQETDIRVYNWLLYTSPSPRD